MKVILFDLDGTLIDSGKDIAVAANYALKKLGKPELPEEQIIKHVGYGGYKLIQGILDTKDQNLINEGVKYFRDYYFSHPVDYTKPYDKIPELLENLKEDNKHLAVITNKYEDISKQILKELDLLEFFDIVVGGDTTDQKKPDPKPILYALETLSHDPEEAIMIGDSEADIKAGKSAETKTCLVTYGFGKTELARSFNPDFEANSVEDLFQILQSPV